jgi:hypothetical protein
MRYLKYFEGKKETISVNQLIDDLKKADPEDFGDSCEKDGAKSVMSEYLTFINIDLGDTLEGDIFKLIDSYTEKGDGKDEETQYAIFKRKTDGKDFKFWIHDAGFIGPSTLTMCDELEEVTKIEVKKNKWS